MNKHFTPRVGEFLDVSNLRISAAEEYGPDARINFDRLREFTCSLGVSASAQAFCIDTGKGSHFFHYLRGVGYDVEILTPKAMPDGKLKGNVDPLLAFTLCETVARHRLGVVVLGTGDVDFVPVVRILRNRKIDVVVIGPSPRHTASELVFAASRFFTLADLDLISIRPRPGLRSPTAAPTEQIETQTASSAGTPPRNGAVPTLGQNV